MSGRRWLVPLGATLLVLSGVGCGGTTATPASEAPTAPAAAPSPSQATVVAASPVASPSAAPTATAAAARQATVYVGNTDGEGVYIRKTPAMADKLQAYPDGTPLTIVGPEVEGDGQQWKTVKTPDGLVGYVPTIYTSASQ